MSVREREEGGGGGGSLFLDSLVSSGSLEGLGAGRVYMCGGGEEAKANFLESFLCPTQELQ